MGKPNPRIDGTSGDDFFILGSVDGDGDILSNVNQDIYTYGGHDIISGGDAIDRIWAGDGDDFVFGNDGNDNIRGENGDDTILGGDGNDQIRGGRGNDAIFGGKDNDQIWGNKGNNFLDGGEGNDYINSGDQTSTLLGGEGNDTLELRMKKGGDHIATGGTGADEFQFSFAANAAQSDVIITDFELGVDTFSQNGIDAATLMASLGAGAVTDAGGNALLTLASGDTVLFQGVSEADFEDFFGL